MTSPEEHSPDRGELLLIGGASARPGSDSLTQAAARGLRVCLVDTAQNLRSTPELAERAHRVVALDYTDSRACTEWALRQSNRFCGVYGFRETAVQTVAEVASALRLAGNLPESVELVRNKDRCREALRLAGFRQPASAHCSDEQGAGRFLDEHPNGPWVVKPLVGRGSAGVSVVGHRDELPAAARHAREGLLRLEQELQLQGIPVPPGPFQPAGFLIEEFQQGSEYSAEGIFVDGRPRILALTAKATTGPPHFIESGHVLPAPLLPEVAQAAREQVAAALVTVGLRWGVFHVEFWVAPPGSGAATSGSAASDGTADESPIVLGELHVRPGGDYIHVLTRVVTGVQLHGSIFDQMLGRHPEVGTGTASGAAAVRFLMPAPGRLAAVDNWPAVQCDPRFLKGSLNLTAGSTIGEIGSSMDRSSYLIATAPESAAAQLAAEDLVQQISLTYADPNASS